MVRPARAQGGTLFSRACDQAVAPGASPWGLLGSANGEAGKGGWFSQLVCKLPAVRSHPPLCPVPRDAPWLWTISKWKLMFTTTGGTSAVGAVHGASCPLAPMGLSRPRAQAVWVQLAHGPGPGKPLSLDMRVHGGPSLGKERPLLNHCWCHPGRQLS